MKKIKILFPFVGDTLGGSHISTLSLIDELNQKDFDVMIIVYKKGRLTNYLEQVGYHYLHVEDMPFVDNLNVFFKSIMAFYSFFKSFLFLKKYDFDIVHTNDLRMHYSWVFACCFSNASHVWHQRSDSKRGVFLSVLSSKLLTITNFCKSSFPFVVRDKAVIIDDPVSVVGEGRPSGSLDRLSVKISWVGNIIEKKRLDTAVRVIAKIKEKIPGIELQIFGERREPIYSEVKELISELGVSRNIKFMGVKTPISEWLVETDILLATAESEGMGRALVEAMLLGLPVIASDHGGHKEVVENGTNGLLVPLESVEGYAESILLLVDDDEHREHIIESAKVYSQKRYSESVHADSVVHIYKEILNKNDRNV